MNYELWKKNKKIVASLIIFVILFSSLSPVFARKAEAQWVDWANLIPNTVGGVSTWGSFMKIFLDAAAYQMINLVIQKMTASTVNWINKGFKGSPAFMTNPQAYYGNMADNVVGQFVFGPQSKLNFLCAPIKAKIKIALTKNYLGDNKQWNCSLTQAGKNMDNFMGDFENGGWDSFFEISQNTTMNPIGAYLQAENDMNIQIANKQVLKNQELDWGKGFLSYKSCKRYAGSVTPSAGSGSATTGTKKMVCSVTLRLDVNNGACPPDKLVEVTVDSEGNEIPTQDIGPGIEGACLEEETLTPGSVIQDKLNSVLKIGDNRIGVSNAINQLLSALINQVANQIVGGVGRGLRGMSKPDSTVTGSPSLADQLLAEEREADTGAYFQSNSNVAKEALKPENIPNPNLCRDDPNNPECNAPADYCDQQCRTCRDNPSAEGCPTAIPEPTP